MESVRATGTEEIFHGERYFGSNGRLEKGFWDYADKSGDCWEWIGAKNSKGRAMYRGLSAPRIAWTLTHGDPGDLNVCHHCDNPGCVKPGHLFLGTQLENVHDMISKGRKALVQGKRGDASHFARLTWADAKAIRTLAAQGVQCKKLARIYSVGRSQISRIVTGQAWNVN